MRKMEKLKKDRINAQKEKAQTGHSGPFWMSSKGSLYRKCVQNPSTSLSGMNGQASVSGPLNVLQKIAARKTPVN